LDTAIAIIGVVVTAIGTLTAILAFAEFHTLRQLRKNFEQFEARIRREHFQREKAAHRIIASYQIKDVDQKIGLLQAAISAHPDAFNGYNALGYAFLEKGDTAAAMDAFNHAIRQHPDAKEGYFDLAGIHSREGNDDLCIKYLIQAIQVDPTSKDDLVNDPRFHDLARDDRLKRHMFM